MDSEILSQSVSSLMLKSKINARQKVIEQCWIKYFRMLIKKSDYSWIPDNSEKGQFVEMMSLCNSAEEEAKLSGYLITINPPSDEYDWYFLQKVVEQILNKKEFLGDLYVTYEQRSDDPQSPYGWHCHIFAFNKYGRPKSDIVRRIYQSFIKLIKNREGRVGVTDSIVDIKEKKTQSSIDNAIKYIKGEKTGDKEAKVDADLYIKDLMGLEPFEKYIDADPDKEEVEQS